MIRTPEQPDDLVPTTKDPAEGGRDSNQGAQPAGPGAREEGHLGAGGDPAEGGDPEPRA